jgi:hypothetical protein
MEFRQKEFRHLNFDIVEILMELRQSVGEVEGVGVGQGAESAVI